MANEVDVTIRTTDKGGDNVRKLGGAFDGLVGKLLGASSALDIAGRAFDAIGTTARAAWSALEEGAALQLAQDRFDNLAASIGTTADALTGELAAATQGMLSNAQIVSSATDIISLGLGDTSEEVVRLGNLVGQLGWDMQVLTLTLANDSTMRLDSLGLSVSSVTARMEELKASGMAAGDAFDLAVIEAGEQKLELLGSAADSSAGKIQVLKAQWEDATNAFKAEFAASVVDQLEAVTGAIQDNGPAFQAGMGELGRKAGDVMGAAMNVAASVGLESLNKQIAETVGISHRELQTLYNEIADQEGMGIWLSAEEDLRLAQLVNERLVEENGLVLSLTDSYRAWADVRMEDDDIGRETVAVTDLGQAYEYLIEQYDLAGDAADKAASKAKSFQDWLKGRDREAEAVTGTGRAYEYLIGQYDAAADAAEQASEEQAAAAEDAADAAEENARRIAEAFQQAASEASGYFVDAMSGLQDWQVPDLVTPERDVSYVTSGPSQEQLNLLDEYQQRYDDAATKAYELSVGLGTVGLSQEQLNERIADANSEMAHYAALMGGMQLPATQTATAHQDLAFNMDMVQEAMYNAGVSAGWSVTQIGELGVSIGEFTPEAADAATKTALFYSALDILAQERKLGNLDTSEYTAAVEQLVSDLESNSVIELQVKMGQIENPPRESWAGLPKEERTLPIEADPTPVQTALGEALGFITGVPDADRTLPILADYEAVLTATETEIPDAISAIPAEARTIDFLSDTKAVDDDITRLDDSHIQIVVDYVLGTQPEIPGKAGGGAVDRSAPYIVGEAGPELFIPWADGRIVPNNQVNWGEGGGIEIHNYFYGPTNAADVARATDTAGRRLLERLSQMGMPT